MEENKRCKKCGAPLLADEDRCPICDTVQNNDHDQITEKKNYWKNPIIWTFFVVLLIISVAINGYLNVNPIELADQKDVDEQAYEDAVLTIDEETSQYAQATNNNGLAVSYVNKDKVYIVMNQELIAYDKQLNNREHVYDFALTDFKDDGKYYYYLDENNDYYRVDKESKSEDVLLTNVYYVQNLGEKIYYQKDSDNESIYCLDLSTNEDKKIIFVTSHNHRYKEAFGPNVYGFVSKNNLEDELVESVSKMLVRIKNQHSIDLKIDGEILEIKTDSIIYCMYLGDMNIAVIFDDRQAIIKNKTLKSLLRILGNDFICINRSVIINKKKILKMQISHKSI